MSEDRKQILQMLAHGKINADEAERLIAALEKSSTSVSPESKSKPKYLRVVVESEDGASPTRVNVRVPLQLLRAGVKLASLIPVPARIHVNEALRENGVHIDLTQLKPENLDELIENLNDLTVDVDDQRNKVKVFCE